MKKNNFMDNRNRLHEHFKKCIPNVAENFDDIMDKTFIDAALTAKTKELIALGISVSLRCEPCMKYHIEKAINQGANKEELFEAMQVGYEMTVGAVIPPLRKVLYEVFSDIE